MRKISLVVIMIFMISLVACQPSLTGDFSVISSTSETVAISTAEHSANPSPISKMTVKIEKQNVLKALDMAVEHDHNESFDKRKELAKIENGLDADWIGYTSALITSGDEVRSYAYCFLGISSDQKYLFVSFIERFHDAENIERVGVRQTYAINIETGQFVQERYNGENNQYGFNEDFPVCINDFEITD
jgi:hypothetical protein